MLVRFERFGILHLSRHHRRFFSLSLALKWVATFIKLCGKVFVVLLKISSHSSYVSKMPIPHYFSVAPHLTTINLIAEVAISLALDCCII